MRKRGEVLEEARRRRKRKTPHEKGVVRRSSNKWLQLVTIVLRAPTKPLCRTARPPNPRGFSHTYSRYHMRTFAHVWYVCARCHAARNIDKHDTKVGHEQRSAPLFYSLEITTVYFLSVLPPPPSHPLLTSLGIVTPRVPALSIIIIVRSMYVFVKLLSTFYRSFFFSFFF